MASFFYFGVRAFAAGGWLDSDVGSVTLRGNWYGDDRSCSCLADPAASGTRSGRRFHNRLSVSVFVLDWGHPRTLPGTADQQCAGRNESAGRRTAKISVGRPSAL